MVKGVSLDKIIDTLSWYKTWLLSGYNLANVKRKLLRKHKRACKSSWSRPGNQKSVTLQIPWNFGSLCGELTWNHCTSKRIGLLKEQRRMKEGTSAVLLQSCLGNEWWADSTNDWLVDSMECYSYLRNIQDLLSDGRTPYERRFG